MPVLLKLVVANCNTFIATQLVIAAFIVPYILGLNPSLLVINTNSVEVFSIILTSLVGIFGESNGIRGYSILENEPVQRMLLIF